jgi:hypothetical protein
VTASELTPEQRIRVDAFGIHPESDAPPVAKYRLTVVIDGNSHDEVERELLSLTRGGYLLHSDYYKRDNFEVYGGREHSILEHRNPEMTPERYERELHEWADRRKAVRS